MAMEILNDGATFEEQRTKINNNFGTTQSFIDDPLGQAYVLTPPSGGDLRTFDPNTTTIGQMARVLATLLKDLKQ